MEKSVKRRIRIDCRSAAAETSFPSSIGSVEVVSPSPVEEEQKAEGEHSDERKRVGRCYRAVRAHEGACKHELFDSAYRH